MLIQPWGKDSALILALAVCVLLLAQGGPALAQEIPPFPILYGGRALVDGEPLPEGTRLVARVGDYETWTTVEQSGAYRNLLVAPLSREYHYVPVTFHALEMVAEERDVFLPSGAPIFKDIGFDLHFSRPVVEPSPQPTPSPRPTSSPQPTPSPTAAPTPPAPQAGDGNANASTVLSVAIGAGVVLVVVAGWFGLRRRRRS